MRKRAQVVSTFYIQKLFLLARNDSMFYRNSNTHLVVTLLSSKSRAWCQINNCFCQVQVLEPWILFSACELLWSDNVFIRTGCGKIQLVNLHTQIVLYHAAKAVCISYFNTLFTLNFYVVLLYTIFDHHVTQLYWIFISFSISKGIEIDKTWG
jgi:hypothetical protein